MTDKPDAVAELVERLRNEGNRNGGQGAYAWQARELCKQAADTLTTLSRRNAELEAENARHVKAMQRCIEIVKHNLYRQREKVGDVPLILRAALGGTDDKA